MEAEQRKKNILECSKKLFSKNGYHNTQISDIIEEAKIARGTVYQYFKNKDDIFITLLKNYYKQWEKYISLDSSEIDLTTVTAQKYFRHRVKKTLIFFSSDQELCKIVLRMGLGLRGELETNTRRFQKKIIAIVSNDLEMGKRNKTIKNNINTELTAHLLSGALFNIAYHLFVTKGNKKHNLDEISDQILDIYMNIFI